jgi:osmoprotectant transport system substrate-binding protein
MAGTKSLTGVVLLLALSGCSKPGAQPPIKIGSKNFTEQVVLGEIIAQHLEHRLHRSVERSLNLGGTLLAHQALLSRQIDLYPEYTGTALAAILKDPLDTDPAAVLARVRSQYLQKFQAEWLDPLGIDDTFAMVVSGAEARARGLETLTDAAKTPEAWALGVGYEFEQRADGLAALEKSYHVHWKGSPKTMDLGLLYQAIQQGQVTMIAANSTDGLLSKLDLKVLRDDQHAFPPYQVCIVASQDAMRATPGLREALQELSGKFTNQQMQHLNLEVDAEHRPVAQVAAEFLKQSGLE